ncbi:MAG TPA: hypothetical protein VG013_34395 [Gemmataceae bacterium]|jgi:hypothetical protein|nr:hypothetical protein [Gemmataceae bacterium]
MTEFLRGLCAVATTALTSIVGIYYVMLRRRVPVARDRAEQSEAR